VEEQRAPVWAGFIQPRTILAQVDNTAPFLRTRLVEARGRLVSLGTGAGGFLRILGSATGLADRPLTRDEQLQDYFALCLAAHHATVATFVPTDLDSKIRGLLWRESRDRDVLRSLCDLAFEMHGWSLDGISRRAVVFDGAAPVSG
jgi:hypothetical protein